MRFRFGNDPLCECAPGGSSDSTSPRSDDLAMQRDVRTWIGDVGAGAEDGDRRRRPPRAPHDAPTASIPSAIPLDDARAGAGERPAELARDAFAVSRRAPRADDRDERLCRADSRSPIHQSRAGGFGRSFSAAGYAASRSRTMRSMRTTAFTEAGRRRGERRPSSSSRAAASTSAASSGSSPAAPAALIANTPNASGASIGGASSSPSKSIFVKTTQCGFSASAAE